MPAVSHRGSSRRRTISEINMVPFIDVMLVLLIIFMVTAPLITTGLVDLPSVAKSSKRPEHVVELVVAADERLRLRVDGKEGTPLALREVAAKVSALQAGDAAGGATGGAPALRCRMLENSSMKLSSCIAMRSISRAKRL